MTIITALKLTNDMCRWPFGDPKEEGFHFCGDHSPFESPYCEKHAALSRSGDTRSRKAASAKTSS
ncbi:MAG: GcrA family cell cycle regulator [Alphaproteobacteria bacterium]|nr:GcrA family cell cycle regulator [Alphaproteobacteria bacterium]